MTLFDGPPSQKICFVYCGENCDCGAREQAHTPVFYPSMVGRDHTVAALGPDDAVPDDRLAEIIARFIQARIRPEVRGSGPAATVTLNGVEAAAAELAGLVRKEMTKFSEALAVERAVMRDALMPFATFGARNVTAEGWDSSIHREEISTWFGPSEFRAARIAAGLDEGDAP